MELPEAPNTVVASAVVTGGVPPFSYEWSSEATTLEGVVTSERTLSYEHTSRAGDCQDKLHLRVTDGRGLFVAASKGFEVTGCEERRSLEAASSGHRRTVFGVYDVGVEYINESGGLSNSKSLALGFSNCMANHGNNVKFEYGDLNAWEMDWKDPVYDGIDYLIADNVDFALFSGHGSSLGWYFEGQNHDTLLHYNDARFGNYDLEWLAIHACQVLKYPSRWENAFHGLHMMLGFENNSYDLPDDGKVFCAWLNGIEVFWIRIPPAMVRQAWEFTADAEQLSGVKYRMMGPVRADGVSNINDYYWFKGNVGPDIPASQIDSFWVVSGTV